MPRDENGGMGNMNEKLLYSEKLSSKRTEALFLGLMMIFLLLFLWRDTARGLDWLAITCLCVGVLFLFYSINYRRLKISLTAEHLTLKFGVFRWRVRTDNIGDCALDEIPAFMRNGGAGIHFMMIRNRYRASFNFLEYSRVVIAFKQKAGPVQDISFSTRQPEDVLRVLRETMVGSG
jgi:Ca2+/Na+ antiporter